MIKANTSTYLDYNATVPTLGIVKKSMIAFMDFGPVNASSVHFYGRKGKNVIEHAKANIAELINTKSENVIFTSSATESINLLFSNFNNIIVSSIEHLAVLSASKSDQIISVNKNGVIDIDNLEVLLKKNSKNKKNILVSVMWVNNETGVVQPIEDVVKLSKKYGCLVHCDAAQALGKVKIDLKKVDLDFLTLSGHKIGAPAGIGALVNNKNFNLNPQILGGGQEKGMRAGTENIIGIFGFGEAAAILKKMPEYSYEKVNFLRDYLSNKIKLVSPETVFFGNNVERVNNTLLIASPNIPGDLALMKLDIDAFSVSSGSACSSGKISQSHVLKAMGYETLASNSIRLSFPPNDIILASDNLITTEELDRLAQCWSNI
ncbi:cysteine desulfurase [Alphaproteobacteria bacterium]|nr:cysteine desulfurase [Alphaproteobacteria bacterium]